MFFDILKLAGGMSDGELDNLKTDPSTGPWIGLRHPANSIPFVLVIGPF